MDSDNSGSPQSSSTAGNEEYDSRAAAGYSISAFMTVSPPTSFDNPDPNPTSILNSSLLWPNNNDINSTPLRSDPIPDYSSFPVAGTDNGLVAGAPPPAAARNPKKRSRASRRAPTTVLTTDTTNFRAMVQEFTGIPAPPFGNPSLLRNRLDLSDPTPPYLRRPFPQKLHSPPSFPIVSASSFSEPSNLYTISNPVFDSLLQSNVAKFPFSNSFLLGSKSLEIPSNDDSTLKMGGLGHGNHVPIFETIVSSNQSSILIPGGGDNRQDQMRGVFPVDSSSNFRAEKGTENVAARSGGTMEQWVCSSE